jgi:glycosyltransferase involved in cell wall biosynthesis
MPRVSVIIPARNAASVLTQALDSVVAQTYRDWEAIVADDASTDATAAVANGRDPRISCVRSTRGLGIGGARNLALSRARGELIALLDADDMWLPEYLARQVGRYDAAVARGENVGIVCCDAYELGPHGRRAHTYSHRSGWVNEVTLTTLLHGNTIFVSAVAPRAVVEEVGGFATDCLGTEDYDLWLRILETGRRVVCAREPLVVYRVADATVSANVAAMSRATQTTYRNALLRGHLTRAQRQIARRELRLQSFVERWENAAQRRAETGRTPLRQCLRAAPLGLRVILERPGRWLHWLRIAIAIARGAPAAGVDRTRSVA